MPKLVRSESGQQKLKNVDGTHLVLASGQLGLKSILHAYLAAGLVIAALF